MLVGKCNETTTLHAVWIATVNSENQLTTNENNMYQFQGREPLINVSKEAGLRVQREIYVYADVASPERRVHNTKLTVFENVTNFD